MVYRLLSFILLVSSFVYPESILASDSLSYSGRLVKADGSPVSGEVNLKFDLAYTTPSGVGAVLCSQSLPSVSLAHGVFHVKLEPDCSPASLNAVLAQTPAGESVAIRVTDETSGKSYSYQVLHSIPFAQVSKQLTQMGAGLNDILQWDGTQWSPSPVGGGGGVGTVKEIQTGTGLSGGPITATGTISIANGGVNTSQLADGAVTDNKLSSNISRLKLATGTPNYVLMNNGAGVMSEVPQVPLAQGGTGAANAADARTNLGLGLAALLNTGMGATNVLIGGDVRSCEAFEKLQWNLAPVMGWSCVIDKDSLDTTKLPLDGSVAMTGELNMGAKQIKNLAEPLIGTDAATMNYVDTKVGAIETTQWITAGSDIYFDLGRVGIGTSTPETILNIDTAGSGFDKHYIRNRTSSTGLTWEDMAGLSFIKNHSDDSSVNSATVTNEAYGEVAFGGVNSGGENFHSANIIATQVGAASASGPNGAKLRFGTALGDGTSLTTRMIIDNTGYVGIGVLTPSEKLEVSGNIATSGSLKLKSGAVNYVEVKAPLSLGGPLNFILPGTAGSSGQALITDGAGNLSWSSVATTATSLNGDLSGPISNAQINSGAVGSTEIADLSITNSDIANGTITFSKLNFAANDLSIPLVNGLQLALDGKEPTITASDTTKWWRGDKTWQALTTSDVAEGSREYFTQAKVRSTPLTGYAIGANTALLPGDSLLGALGKLQGQISGNGQWLKNDPNIYYNGGNVGIGTTSPSSYQHGGSIKTLELHNSGTASDSQAHYYVSSASNNANSAIGGLTAVLTNTSDINKGVGYIGFITTPSNTASTPSSDLYFATRSSTESNWSNKMTIGGNGNVGIGTAAPVAKLQVNNESGTIYTRTINSRDSSFNNYFIGHSTGISHMGTNGPGLTFHTMSDMGFTGTSLPTNERMRIDSSGNVGIGTSAPASVLHVEAADNSALRVTRNNVQSALLGDLGSTDHGQLNLYNSSGTIGVLISSAQNSFFNGGNVGIGTNSPTTKLDVLGDITVGSTFSGTGEQRINFRGANTDLAFIRFVSEGDAVGASRLELGTRDNSDEPIVFSQTGLERVRIGSGGNVGIGTATPGYKLDVNGTIRGFGITDSSDIRLKKNIENLSNEEQLKKILQLQGVSYLWKDPELDQKLQIGFIAQEMEKIFPELVETDASGMKSVNYSHLVSPIVGSIQALHEKQNREVASLKKQNEELKSENEMIKAYLCAKDPEAIFCAN